MDITVRIPDNLAVKLQRAGIDPTDRIQGFVAEEGIEYLIELLTDETGDYEDDLELRTPINDFNGRILNLLHQITGIPTHPGLGTAPDQPVSKWGRHKLQAGFSHHQTSP